MLAGRRGGSPGGRQPRATANNARCDLRHDRKQPSKVELEPYDWFHGVSIGSEDSAELDRIANASVLPLNGRWTGEEVRFISMESKSDSGRVLDARAIICLKSVVFT
jgi:hypothetical protein